MMWNFKHSIVENQLKMQIFGDLFALFLFTLHGCKCNADSKSMIR